MNDRPWYEREWWEFQTLDEDTGQWHSMGGKCQSRDAAEREHANYLYAADRRRKIAPSRLVHFVVNETVVHKYDEPWEHKREHRA